MTERALVTIIGSIKGLQKLEELYFKVLKKDTVLNDIKTDQLKIPLLFPKLPKLKKYTDYFGKSSSQW